MPQTIDLQKAAKVDYEVQPYSSDKENGMTASRSDSSDVSSLSTLVGSEIENMVDHIDIEKAGAEVLGTQSSVGRSRARLLLWMALNTLASILIVFTNKAIFDDPTFRHCQVAFAAFHLFVTALTLYVLSRPALGMFVPRGIDIKLMLPLAVAMCLNVVLQNLSLTYSSITFFQIARILLTPTVAIINFLFYRKSIPRLAALTLLPMCLGVGLISYYEPRASAGSTAESISFLSVGLALASVLVGSVYTVWIGSYQKRFEVDGFQLLFNQAPMGGILLLLIMPWTDTLPALAAVPVSRVLLILLSGALAASINVSMFFIVAGAGPVSSTVVGHVKTCLIVTLGWITSGRVVTANSAFGILLAIASVFSYSGIMMRKKS